MTLRHIYIITLFIAIAHNIHRLHLEKIRMKIKHRGLFLEELKFNKFKWQTNFRKANVAKFLKLFLDFYGNNS
jgi:hypothetical protein